jgi:hypothetical protein
MTSANSQSNQSIFSLFKRKNIAGAWTPRQIFQGSIFGGFWQRLKSSRSLPIFYRTIHLESVHDLSSMVDAPDGYTATNPSAVEVGNNKLVCVRLVNYALEHDNTTASKIIVGTDWHTLNRFILMDAGGGKIADLPQLNAAFDNVEDVRLFTSGGIIYAIGSLYDPCERKTTAQVKSISTERFEVIETSSYPSPMGLRNEKNWMPFKMKDGISYVYSLQPLILLSKDDADVLQISRPVDTAMKMVKPKFEWSGSCFVGEFKDHWLFLVHRRKTRLFKRDTIYISRFMTLHRDLSTVRYGSSFVLGRATVQFVCGVLAEGENLSFAFGLGDRSASIGKVPLRNVRKLMPSMEVALL